MRSKFEESVAALLNKRGLSFEYEPKDKVVSYVITHTYLPDFVLNNGIMVETKGRLTYFDRQKHLAIKSQHPELDIRFVFQRPYNKIRKRSKTTYSEWAEKHGFKWAAGSIPVEWFNE